jgi:hypothetical protein
LNVQGQFDNLESVTKEVKLMMDPNAEAALDENAVQVNLVQVIFRI